jgi:hypothetical protein
VYWHGGNTVTPPGVSIEHGVRHGTALPWKCIRVTDRAIGEALLKHDTQQANSVIVFCIH